MNKPTRNTQILMNKVGEVLKVMLNNESWVRIERVNYWSADLYTEKRVLDHNILEPISNIFENTMVNWSIEALVDQNFKFKIRIWI